MIQPQVHEHIERERAQQEERARGERLLSDAQALERLSQYPEWTVLDRLLAEHATHLQTELRRRGLTLHETEALRAELDMLDWMRYRPAALRRALESRDAVLRAQEVFDGRPDPE